MDSITKDEIALVIKEMDKLTISNIDIFFVGSIASIIGYDTSKQTNDADTYNSITTHAVELWNKACEIAIRRQGLKNICFNNCHFFGI
ncbi:MAG: hypothetical protein A2622_11715 [Bdellovibrionales bacterium RIFCSPHIGHO2_01_FULL_40_29]|nr:MAG: hypothetical protein A2622_11715 [Bdellovibrionales bacterium RIFCSPHIGHO2_01_FULL_40_29]OFZ35274.1 MAG: hypothetical protein A3D17_08710 [Bdellovibrionales bacterium RIFCSPHIGHO2_02_FULL_40_15]